MLPDLTPADRPAAAPASPHELRRFGLTVGGAFLALAALGVWRHRPLAVALGAPLGALLVGVGLAAPARLGGVYRAWMALARGLSRVTTPVFLGVVYFGVFTPIGLVMRVLGRRPLARRRGAPSYWATRAPGARASDLRRQF